MWYVLEQFLVFLRIDQLVNNVFLDAGIIHKVSHVHALVDLVSVVSVHHVIYYIDQSCLAVFICFIIIIEIDRGGNIAVVLHYRESPQDDPVILSDVINPDLVAFPCPFLDFFPYQCCKT